MLGILFIYFIGNYYYRLAERYEKGNLWGYAILGVATYYVGTFVAGIIIGLLFVYFSYDGLDNIDDTTMGMMAFPFGLLICWGLYKILERKWEKDYLPENDSTLLDESL